MGKNIFALATDFFFKVGPQGWVGWEDSSSTPQFLEYVFFLCDDGGNEEKEKESQNVAYCWEGGWTSVRDERKGEQGEPIDPADCKNATCT